MTPQKFVIYISGASCTGKSTLIDTLGEEFSGTYTVSYDKLKWQLAGYHRDQRNLIYPLVLGLFEVVCHNGLPIFLNTIIRNAEEFAEYETIAKKYDYTFLTVELTAPLDVLLTRFRERVKSAQEAKSKISVTDEDLFLENAKKKFYVPEGTPTFDTSVLSPGEIAEKVIEIISA